jgi:sigma-B regulation protein RsbU (phosphoserine phosphatase)
MKIKTIITCSYLILIGGLAALVTISNLAVVDRTTKGNINAMLKYEEKAAINSMRAAHNIILPHGRAYIQMETRIIAREFSDILKKKKIRNEEELKSDRELRKIAIQKIHVSGKVVGYMDLFDNKGTAVFSPNKKVEGVNYKEWKEKFPKLYELVKTAISGKDVNGFYSFYAPDGGPVERKYASFVQVPDSKYIIVSTVYLNEYIEPLIKQIEDAQSKDFSALKNEINETLSESFTFETVTNAFIILLVCLIAICGGCWLAEKISRPIVTLHSGVKEISGGNFAAKVQEQGFFETVSMARTFNELGQRLQSYMENLETELGRRKAFESEVKIVAQIQQAILPEISKEFQRDEFSLNVKLRPAKEAAGDFYDFFFVEENKLAMLIADVAGKGLSAAFFMTIAKTLLNSICRYYPNNPESALEEANNILAQNNSESMFVTVFLIYYDIKTGEISYANAGHHAAMKIDSDGEISGFGIFNDLVLGFLPETSYKQGKAKLEPGQKVLLFTDGSFEACSCDTGEFYGEERLKTLVKKNYSMNVNELCDSVVKDILEFENGPQSDDIALLAFKREK